MIQQSILPFKLKKTPSTLTSHSGLTLFGEFVHGLGVSGLIDKYLPKPGSNSGYFPSRTEKPEEVVDWYNQRSEYSEREKLFPMQDKSI